MYVKNPYSIDQKAGIALMGLFLVLGLLLPYNPAQAQQEGEILLFSWDFENGAPTEWQGSGWQVVEVDGGHAFMGQGHIMLPTIPAGLGTDYRLRFRVKLEGNAGMHANVRYNEPARYFIGLWQQGMYLSKQLGEDKFENNLKQANGIGSGWRQVEIAVYGPKITVSVDGNQRMAYTDPEPIVSGGFSFESLQDAPVLIDDIEVWGKPISSMIDLNSLNWVYTGGPLGGLGYDVRMRPDNLDIMFVTDAFAGVFKSTDCGKTWFPANEGITTRIGESGDNISVFCLTIDPHNNDIVWAGTQYQRGIFKSVDGGGTWSQMNNGVQEKGITFRGFTVDPASSDIVYAAGEISSWEWSGQNRTGREFDMTQGAVYKTTDGGQNWVKILQGDDLARYIWIDPRNPQVLYVSHGIFDREAANSDPVKGVPGGVGILKSTDGGQTWQPANNGLKNLYVGSLFMHPQNLDILLAGAGNVTYHEGSGAYLSTNGGATWTQTLDAYVISSVEFSTSNPEIAYAANFGAVYRSEDGGHTWKVVTGGEWGWGAPGARGGTPIDIQVDPRDPNRLFIDNYGGGNFLSEDGGRTWSTASKGYSGGLTRDVVVDPTAPGHVVAAVRSGIFSTYNGGKDWIGISNPPVYNIDWHAVAIDPSNPEHLISELTCPHQLVESFNGGANWQVTYQGSGNFAWRSIKFAPSNPKIVYAGSAGYRSCGKFDMAFPGLGVYVSQDGGHSWSRAGAQDFQDAAIFDLAIDPNNPQVVYAATTNYGVIKTSDGGNNWTALNAGMPGAPSAISVAIHPGDPNLLFAGRWRGGLFHSTDGGVNWQIVQTGLSPEGIMSDLIFDPTNSQIIYLADMMSGVYRSEDGGQTWFSISKGLTNRAINVLAISADGQHLYAASEGAGVFRLDLTGQPPAEALTPTQVSTQAPVQQPTAAALPAATVVYEQPAAANQGKLPFCLPCAGAALPIAFLTLWFYWRKL